MFHDLPRSGRPSTSLIDENIDKVKQMMMKNRLVSLKEIAQDVDMSHETVRTILADVLGMRLAAARLVPRELNFLQKEHCKQIAQDMTERAIGTLHS